MYDSTNPFDIPADAPMVAGYVDGFYEWPPEGWARFPQAVKVRIATRATTNDGHVLDVEQFDATPDQVPGWVSRRRAAGVEPSAYVNLGNMFQVVQALLDALVNPIHYWLATLDGRILFPPGVVACQYAGEALTGAHYDLSQVLDFWPGVDVALEPPVLFPPGPVDVMPAEVTFPAVLVLPVGG